LKALLFYILFIATIISSSNQYNDALDEFIDAEMYMLLNDFDLAEQSYKKALESINYESPETIYIELIKLYKYKGEYSNALKYISAADSIESLAIDLLHYEVLLKISDDMSSIVLDDILSKPGVVDHINQLLEIQYSNHKWEHVIKVYSYMYEQSADIEYIDLIIELGTLTDGIVMALKLSNSLILSSQEVPIDQLYRISLLCIDNGLNEIGLKNLDYILSINPKYEPALSTLAEIYINEERHVDALANLNTIYSQGDRSLYILKLLAECERSVGNYDRMLDIAYDIVERYNDEIFGYLVISNYYKSSKNFKEAKKILYKAEKRLPREPYIQFEFGSISSLLGKFDKAKKYFFNAMNLDPDNSTFIYRAAVACEDDHDYDCSDTLFTKLFNKHNNPFIYNDYAYMISNRLNVSKEKLQYALELVDFALINDPNNYAFLDTKGWIFYKLEDYFNAEKFIREAYDNNTNSNEVLFHLADICFQTNKMIEAKNIYNKLLELDYNVNESKQKIKLIDEQYK